MSDGPTWYDVLGVPRDASSDDIRTAWKAQIADLEPGDRRFDSLNRAAKVLLDPAARTAYDAAHPEVDDEPPVEEGSAPIPGLTDVEAEREKSRLLRHRSREGAAERRERSREQAAERRTAEKEQKAARPARAPGGVPSWLLAGLGLLAAGLVAATVWMWVAGDDGGDDSAARAAQVAAERAVVPVLSYDYETLDEDQKAAQALMTGSYRTEYDKLFAVLEENAPETQTRVTASVVASGIVRASADRVQVLVFVDRPTTNKLSAEPVVYKDQVTLSMQLVDDTWLVDDMVTSPVQG
ncbi:J domain-containing protein [Nocardioides baculatus]|uniref:DnaJ domain-containing protein n=1 Tax=Nocardioides baculatus TaxID=2801337 RepID=A0ABS1L2R5_9ACTN|nr:DnaJ domain-containing protein [Nocardioides baculatus]MBL0745991.1 DnaJ domain-containing protein [Nocardioides baculatus]